MLIAANNAYHIASNLSQSSSSSSAQRFSDEPATACQQAISSFQLTRGWQAFGQDPWVADLTQRIPQAQNLATTCSAHRPEYQQQAKDLFLAHSQEDRLLLKDYFLGKLGLEELSCRRSGAGAGACDKRAAFMEIYRIAVECCRVEPDSRPGILI